MKRKVYLVTGKDPIEFTQAYNKATEQIEVMAEKFISDTSAYLFYDADDYPDDVIETIRKRAEAAYEERQPDYIIDAAEKDFDTKSILIELRVDVPVNRYCAECDNYDWGRGCPYRDDHVRIKDAACPMFNIEISRG